MNIQFHFFGNCQLDLYNLKNYLKKIYATVKASLLSLEKEDIIAEKHVPVFIFVSICRLYMYKQLVRMI